MGPEGHLVQQSKAWPPNGNTQMRSAAGAAATDKMQNAKGPTAMIVNHPIVAIDIRHANSSVRLDAVAGSAQQAVTSMHACCMYTSMYT